MGYVDTSALVAYYCPEALSAKVQQELRQEAELTISPLVDAEFHSAISMKVRSGELRGSDGRRIVTLFRLDLARSRYRTVPIGDREYQMARDWLATFATSLRALDALHMAAAFANALTILTTDPGLAGCAKHFGVECRLIS
ncbi:MAG: type II toxin-antitoxin system VapC family toxin [Planctomycetes bacterium]|nr:type II toxin-antitoxin system VapC family toxin [Planctomycetota bacterium]